MRENTDGSDAVIQKIMTRFGFTRPFAAMLARRGLADDAAIESFLHPESQELADPFAFSDMDRAVSRIRRAIAEGERICVYGDYEINNNAKIICCKRFFTIFATWFRICQKKKCRC